MDSVSKSIRAEVGSESRRSLGLGSGGISWAEHIAEFLDGALANELHTSDNVTLHESVEIRKERLALVLSIELVGLLRLRELANLELRNSETALLNGVDDLTSLRVTVGLDHGEGAASGSLELLLGIDISVVDQPQLSRVDADERADEELSLANALDDGPPHKNPPVFQVVL